jgi:UDP-N-acetylglucosamine transferase subunit ALG13/ubiquinone/menaquinone biosynthesis C-methylase UbiE
LIFVTVGNHNQGFERLLRKVDELAANKIIQDVFIQTGYSNYQPKHCHYAQFVEFNKFQDLIKKSDFVITHAGAGSILNSLLSNKPVIVVPRLKGLGEHINDHQLQLTRLLENENKIIAVYDVMDLEKAINKLGDFKFKTQLRESGVIELIEDYVTREALEAEQNNTNSEHWNVYHEQWADRREIPANPRIIRAICSTLDIKKKKILEVGSGSGRDSIYLAKIGADNYLVDYVEAPLKIANEIAEREKLKITAIKTDAKKLPFPDDNFDFIFSGGLIEHFTEPEHLIKEQVRVLKKGGYLLIDVPQRYHVYTLVKHFLMLINRWAPGWETEYSIRQLERLMKSCGLQIESTYGDWSHPNFFLKSIMMILNIPRKTPEINLSENAKGFIGNFKKSRFAHYTFQHIGVIGKK